LAESYGVGDHVDLNDSSMAGSAHSKDAECAGLALTEAVG
jgi:hypothetical protein